MILILLALGLWCFVECYQLFLDSHDRAILAKQLLSELVNESVVLTSLTDTTEAARLVGEALIKWNTLERLLPMQVVHHQKIREVLLTQQQQIWESTTLEEEK